ncbi:MAG: quinone-dependent dihydroorotate dehydrogenase [Saprospiraceae bacterium]
MYRLIRTFLFLVPAEKAHYLAMNTFKIICCIPIINSFVRLLFSYEKKELRLTQFGLDFKNPIGIAAGFDKDARYIKVLDILGFGFVEVGTVTPLAQAGNPKPRLFRLKKDKALINRMGFNNGGLDQMVKRLKKAKGKSIIIGGNIGKNKATPLEKAHLDYLKCFQKLNPYVDYFVINVSSPNTPGLRSLQDKKPLLKIINTLIDARKKIADQRPILLKIAPDLTDGQLDDIVDILNTTELEGVIATNTTIDRSDLITSNKKLETIGNGGLSGAPLKIKSDKILKTISLKVSRDITFIGAGGINDGATAAEKIENGADLIQIYTGLIYKGPFLVKKIKKYLFHDMA